MSTLAPIPVWNPPLLPLSRLRKGPLVPFNAEGLRTGDCLARLAMGGKTFHITFAKYDRLKEKLPKPAVKPAPKRPRSSKNPDPLLVNADLYSEHVRIHRPDVLSDDIWTTSHDEPFNSTEWAKVPLPWLPEKPEDSPVPLSWNPCVNTEGLPPNPQEYYSSLFRPQFIPYLNKKTAAKTEKGLERFRTKMHAAWDERSALFAEWRKLCPYSGGKQSESHAPPEKIVWCVRCGASIFTKKLVCKDCGRSMRRFLNEREITKYRSDDPTSDVTVGPYTNEPAIRAAKPRGTRRKRPRVPTETFLSVLAERPDLFELLADEARLRGVAITFAILCPTPPEQPMSKDFVEPGLSVNTIDSRVQRFLQAARQVAEHKPIPPLVISALACRYRDFFKRLYPRFKGDYMKLLEWLVTPGQGCDAVAD